MFAKIFYSLLAFLLVLLIAAFLFLPSMADKKMNRTQPDPRPVISEKAKELHARLRIVDLHCDALLWNRDLLKNNQQGHVNLPGMIAGNLGLQAFTIVSKFPFATKPIDVKEQFDLITPLVISQRWPLKTWYSLRARALYQAERLHNYAQKSDGRLQIIKSGADLAKYWELRESNKNLAAGLLGIEGAQVLEGEVANVQILFDAGFRMMAPTHFFDTDMSGSAHGIERAGLTAKGRKMIEKMQELGMIIDLAHASPQTIDDVLEIAKMPVLVSHTGVKGMCDSPRNVSDDHLRGIAATGGVIGIGFWPQATCGSDIDSIVRTIRYTADLIGVEHVALGSDYDGAVIVPFKASQLIYLTEALLQDGFTDEEIAKIMGENAIRVFGKVLL
ncbi:MAG: peptidase M19 [Calditrichaeota bacterium]|nr:MAG: peptidase M19 [Calditrichota bacterium]